MSIGVLSKNDQYPTKHYKYKTSKLTQYPNWHQVYCYSRFTSNTISYSRNEGRITRDTPHFLKSTTLQQFNIECVSTRMNYDFFVLSEDSDNKMEIVQAKGGIPVCCRCRYNAED